MINDAKNNKFDLILTKEISRFSRNTLDSIKYTQELLENGVGVYFLNDNINTILPDSELRLTIMASVAQDEVRKLSERVSFGMRRSIENGVVLGSSNIYGFTKEHGKLIIDQKESLMIKLIFDKYANTNDGLSKISKDLYLLGYKSKTGKRIDPTILTRIIKNPKYKGYYCGNKSKIIDYRNKKKKSLDQSEWIIYKDQKNIPAIISEELWEKANEKLLKRQKSIKNKVQDKAIFQNRYTYSGKLYCHNHQLTYHRNGAGKRKENPVWECQVYRKEGLKSCNSPRIYEKELDKIFYYIFSKILKSNQKITEDLLTECQTYLKNQNSMTKIKELKTKLEELELKKKKLLELLIDDIIEKKEYQSQIVLLKKKSDEYNKKITEIKNISNNKHTIRNKIIRIQNSFKNCLQDKEFFKSFFTEIVDYIIVCQKDSINKKQSILKIVLKTGNNLIVTSNNLGKEYHF